MLRTILKDALVLGHDLTRRQILPETLTVHIWGRIKRVSGKRYEGGVPERSWLGVTCEKHGIVASDYPVLSHGRFDYTKDDDAEGAGEEQGGDESGIETAES